MPIKWWFLCLVGFLAMPPVEAHQRPTKAPRAAVTQGGIAALPSVTLLWDYSDTDIAGFRISRCTAPAVTVDCTTMRDLTGLLPTPTMRQYIDATVKSATRYCWIAQTLAANGAASAFSNQVCLTVALPPPPAPLNLRIAP